MFLCQVSYKTYLRNELLVVSENFEAEMKHRLVMNDFQLNKTSLSGKI
jgi:hypothetical protein